MLFRRASGQLVTSVHSQPGCPGPPRQGPKDFLRAQSISLYMIFTRDVSVSRSTGDASKSNSESQMGGSQEMVSHLLYAGCAISVGPIDKEPGEWQNLSPSGIAK